MTAADAEDGAEMPRARPEGNGRKPREHGMGVSNVTAGSVHSQPAAQMRLMELAVSRENWLHEYRACEFPNADSGASRTLIPVHRGQWSGDRGQFLTRVQA